MRKVFKFSLDKEKIFATTVWNFLHSKDSKKNSLCRNYSRKYGKHKINISQSRQLQKFSKNSDGIKCRRIQNLTESNSDGTKFCWNQILTEWNSDTVLIEFLNSKIGNFQEIFKNSIAICSSDVWHIRILQEFQSELQPESTRILITKSHESTLIRDAIVRCLFDY